MLNLDDEAIIYLNSLFSKKFTISFLKYRKLTNLKNKIILAPRGMLKQSALKNKYFKKWLFIKWAKWYGLYDNITWHATNAVEKQEIQRIFRTDRIFVIDNLTPPINSSFLKIPKTKNKINILFLGRIHPIKNLKFLILILSCINYNINLTVLGNIENEKYKKECDQVQLPTHITLDYLGDRPHKEVNEIINQNHLMVLPTLGENYGHSIIEALSTGRPVLISDQTPWKNLKSYNAGWELPLSDKQAWINAIEDAASWDQAEFDRHCEGALAYAKAHTNNEELVNKYLEMFGGGDSGA